MTDQELIAEHARLWRQWEAEPDEYSSPTIRKYIALIVPLEREAQKRGITKAELMAPIKGGGGVRDDTRHRFSGQHCADCPG